jgi:hypothetical protein
MAAERAIACEATGLVNNKNTNIINILKDNESKPSLTIKPTSNAMAPAASHFELVCNRV